MKIVPIVIWNRWYQIPLVFSGKANLFNHIFHIIYYLK